MNSLELAEDVGILGQDAAGLEHGNAEGEDAAHLQLTHATVTMTQLGFCNVIQLDVLKKSHRGRLRGLLL